MHVYGQLFATLTPDHVISGELARGHTITGSLTIPTVVGVESYDGPYEVIPRVYAQSLDTDRKLMSDDVTVHEIPVTRTSNPEGGLTVLIG